MFLFPQNVILVKGAGDLGTGVAWRLSVSGFPVVMTELSEPLVVRRTVAFATAVDDGEMTVEGVTARRTDSAAEARRALDAGLIPVLIDPETRARDVFSPTVLVDAVMAKRNTGTRMTDAPLVIALGPGFTPALDCHAVIETNRGHNLGRVLWNRPAEPNTGVPGEIGGHGPERVLRAPRAGVVSGVKKIGQPVATGDVIAHVGSARPVQRDVARADPRWIGSTCRREDWRCHCAGGSRGVFYAERQIASRGRSRPGGNTVMELQTDGQIVGTLRFGPCSSGVCAASHACWVPSSPTW